MDNVLIIGGNAREHAICWKLAQSPEVKSIFVAPGNDGIAEIEKVEKVSLDVGNYELLAEWCKTQNVKLVAVGPELHLVKGMMNTLQKHKILCFGPFAEAARIEADKNWAKEFMVRHGIPTARFKSFADPEAAKQFINSAPYPALVVKANGLASGKGVVVASDKSEACSAVDEIMKDLKFGDAGSTVVIEELLEGEEVSVLGFTDGKTVKGMLPSQDHKRLLNGDAGPNTGGMGAYCPCPIISDEVTTWVVENVLQKAVDALSKEKIPFVGVLYAGIMLTKEGPKVLEFNCRFGDPEAECIIPLLKTDIYQIMKACCEGTLGKMNIEWRKNTWSVGVVVAAKEYPVSTSKGVPISGLEKVGSTPGMLIFHGGTMKAEGGYVTNGGRILVNVSLEPSLISAAAKATQACTITTFPGAQYRTDIAYRAVPKWILSQGKLSYKSSGVDISAGNALVSSIKPVAEDTCRPGTKDSLGGFGALFDVKCAGYEDPILVSGTDGVGTKLKIAQSCGVHSSVGIDLVAMCVNDILCHGAEPLFFLDYFACGNLDVQATSSVISGISQGCKMAGCALIGGETAEMPGMYNDGEYDLAGFSVGAVERGKELPLPGSLVPGDSLIALPSSGLHSNGFSLVRNILSRSNTTLSDKTPFSSLTFGEELLTPTRIYIKEVLPLIRQKLVKGVAHITGGGLLENIPRILREDLKANLDASLWKIHEIFAWLAIAGEISEEEMLRTFNCGIGMVLLVSTENKDKVLNELKGSICIGTLESRQKDELQVEVKNFASSLHSLMAPYVKLKMEKYMSLKKIGVLISGTGSNLQALINAINKGGINGEIVLVISNKANVEGLKKAERAGIPTKVIPHTKFSSREDFEKEVDLALRSSQVEIVVLAGFMRVLTGWFVSRWRGKLINIHPALLPLFKGTHAQKQALEAGVRISGCSVHFVEEDIDAGAIIIQEVVPIEPGDSAESLTDKIRVVEHKALPEAVKLLCSDKVELDLKSGKLIWK